MNTYCPACGIDVETQFLETAEQRAWHCASCGLVLKKELVGEPRLRAAASKQVSTAFRAKPAPAAQQQQPWGGAPKPAPAAVEAIDLDEGSPGEFVIEAGGGERRVEAGAPATDSAAPIDLDEGSPGEFVIEAGGGERRIEASAPSAEAGAAIDLDEGSQGDFVIEAGGGERRVSTTAPVPSAPAPAAPALRAPQARPPSSASGIPAIFETVLVAEDDAQLRESATETLLRTNVGREVRGCANGEQLIQAVAEQLAKRASIGMIVLDAEMPVLNGFFAAVALRAFERGLGVPPTPLVFFSALACDDTFRQVLEYSQPARYLHKGNDPTPQGVAQRLAQALMTLRR